MWRLTQLRVVGWRFICSKNSEGHFYFIRYIQEFACFISLDVYNLHAAVLYICCRWKNVHLLRYLSRKEDHTTPGDDRPSSQHSIASCAVWLLFICDISFFPAATDLWTADTLTLVLSHRAHSDVFHFLVHGCFMKWMTSCNDTEDWLLVYKCVNKCVLCSFFFFFFDILKVFPCESHWHEHWTIVGATQLGDAVQKDGGHLLVLVLHKAEHFESKATHLALPVLKDGGLGIFFTADSIKLENLVRKENWNGQNLISHTSPKEKIIAEIIIGVSRRRGITVVHQNVPPVQVQSSWALVATETFR